MDSVKFPWAERSEMSAGLTTGVLPLGRSVLPTSVLTNIAVRYIFSV